MPAFLPLMVILTEGVGDVEMGNKLGLLDGAYQIARMIAEEHVHSVVINLEHPAFDRGLAKALADNLLSPCYSIEDLRAESLYQAIKQEISLIQQKTKSM